ncbi:FadR/GntR family transcriptional regulator [uncultured Ilyobacter sp.]|uniref:FadR/GntR family transcriptional regulator n=1 Tax=uncultured Ilyobacter sp. TaxID=544433 RepID=UPI0029C6E555|nr:FadR/GntR family transcriptional regulator [uncultured Ilyobacter sp.]
MKRKTSDLVFDFIQNKILAGEWKAGEKITSELPLAKELGVSRNSVREAIEKMVTLNVLSKKKGGGTFVREVSETAVFNDLITHITLEKDNYLDILEFRKGFEMQNIKLFLKNSSNEDIEELEEVYLKMEKLKGDSEKFAFYDAEFHRVIARGTKNSIIIKISDILFNLLVFHQKTLNIMLGSESGIRDHRLVLDALKENDVDLSLLFMKKHLNRTIKDVEKIQKKEE